MYLFKNTVNFLLLNLSKKNKCLEGPKLRQTQSENNLFSIKHLAISGGLSYVMRGFKRTFKKKRKSFYYIVSSLCKGKSN